MSNVASLPLCKELYELSGWQDPDFHFSEIDGALYNSAVSAHPHSGIPAYDLGYLLRKLPAELAPGFGITLRMNVARTKWLCGYHKHDDAVADTPENAAAKLCIELFKQGILTATTGEMGATNTRKGEL